MAAFEYLAHDLPLQAEAKKKPSEVIGLNDRSTTGRVWPLHVSGVCRGVSVAILVTAVVGIDKT